MLGDTPCYVDFLLLNAVLALRFFFAPAIIDRCFAWAGCTGTFAALQATMRRPRVKAYLDAADEPVMYPEINYELTFPYLAN